MKKLDLHQKLCSCLFIILVLVGLSPIARAVNVNWIGPDSGNWNTPANWSSPLGAFPPDQAFDEAAAINNNTAVLSAPAMSVTSGGVFYTTDIGGVKLGLTAGSFGGLRITNGGLLTSRRPDNPDPTMGETGAVQVGIAGQGALTVLGGGTLNAASLTSGGANNSSITLGDASPQTATLITEGTATLGRITTVVGPNVNFNAMGNLTLSNTSTLIADIRHATNHSALKTQGTAAVNGTLKPMFTGVTPAVGNRWTLIDAASAINGTFSNIDLSMAPVVPGATFQVVSATNGTRHLLQLAVAEVLVLQVNRDTGAVSIANPGATAKTFDGYSILSPHGSLTGMWNSLQDQGVPGFVEAGPTVNALSELNPGQVPPGSLTLAGGQSRTLGSPYAKTFPAFGVDPDDIVFEYSGPDGQTRQGQVLYTGTKTVNNLVLTVNPATGQAALKNDSPFAIQVDGYSVYSTSGSLQPTNGNWLSLQDQGIAGWEEASPTASALAELRATGAMTLQPGTGFNLGGLFKTTGATQDLRLEFLQAGNPGPSIGAVVYGPFTVPPMPGVGVSGDYNNNGVVDAADYVLWRNGGALQNDPTPGVQPADYTTWRANFGRTAAGGSAMLAAAVPEPATGFTLLCAAVIAGLSIRRRSNLNGCALIGHTD
jgi:hypothetical protein